MTGNDEFLRHCCNQSMQSGREVYGGQNSIHNQYLVPLISYLISVTAMGQTVQPGGVRVPKQRLQLADGRLCQLTCNHRTQGLTEPGMIEASLQSYSHIQNCEAKRLQCLPTIGPTATCTGQSLRRWREQGLTRRSGCAPESNT